MLIVNTDAERLKYEAETHLWFICLGIEISMVGIELLHLSPVTTNLNVILNFKLDINQFA